MNISSSIEDFVYLESYLKKSYSWSPDDRVEYLRKLYDASVDHNIDSLKTLYAEKLGNLYRELDSINLSLHYLNKALESSYDYKSESLVLNSLGGLYRKNRDYEKALEYYFLSLEAAKKLNDGTEAYPLGNISEVYSILENYNEAIKYLRHSISFSQTLETPEKEYSLIYDNSYMASYFRILEMPDSSHLYLQNTLDNIKALEGVEGQKYADAKFVGYYSVSDIYIEEENIELSKEYISKTRDHAQAFYMSSVFMLEARLKMLEKNYTSALTILSSETVDEEYVGQDDVLKLRAQCYEALGQYKKALKLKEEFIEHQKNSFTESQAKFVSFANVKYESLQKNEIIQNLEKENEIRNLTILNQRYLVLFFSLLVMFIGFLSYYLWKRNINKQKLNTQLQAQVDKRTLDLSKANQELRIMNFVASHDLKEPIRTIGSYTGLIHKKLNPEQKQELQSHFAIISKTVEHTHNLLENISHFSNSYELKDVRFSSVDLSLLVDDIVSSIDTYITNRRGVVNREELPTVNSNPQVLFSAIKNIVENGLKFNQNETPTINIKYDEVKENHCIIIEDNGIGIDEEYFDLIFESFKKLHTKTEFQGTGLGLSISKLLLEKIDASIRVESEIGNGTKFVITLPK